VTAIWSGKNVKPLQLRVIMNKKAGIWPNLGLAAGALVLPFMGVSNVAVAQEQQKPVLTQDQKELLDRIKDNFSAEVAFVITSKSGNSNLYGHFNGGFVDFVIQEEINAEGGSITHGYKVPMHIDFTCGRPEKVVEKILEFSNHKFAPETDPQKNTVTMKIVLNGGFDKPYGEFISRSGKSFESGAFEVHPDKDPLITIRDKLLEVMESASYYRLGITLGSGYMVTPPPASQGRKDPAYIHRKQCGLS
jgi:hypothetical protein